MPQGTAVIANEAAQGCNRNDITRHGDNPVTGGLQKATHNDLWEHHMLAKGSSGSVNRLLRPHDVAAGDYGVLDRYSPRARRPGLTEVRPLPAGIEVTEADGGKTGFWPSVIGFLMEGLALCAVAMHPTMLYPPEPHPEPQKMLEPGEIWRRGPISLVSTTARKKAASVEGEQEANQAALAGKAVASADGNPDELEREIEKAVAALAKFDDRTLRDLGIPHRSQIERTVRYCHDC
jgi:hypothetical protein